MNKSQIVLAAIGGTVVLGALVLGYFIWDAASVKAEKAEALDGSLGTASSVMKKLPVKPEKKELAVYQENCEAYGNWRTDAEKIASRGDLVFEKTTPAVFKTAIVGDARKMADLPGSVEGKLVKPDFHFGFKDYITGGALPPDNEAELKRLQREWNDVSSVLKTIAECGGASAGITDVRVGKVQQAASVEEEEQPANRKRKAKKGNKAKAKVESEGQDAGPAVTSFAVDFMTRPSGLVKALNAFATGPRFIVVENCTFARERDALADALGGDAGKPDQQQPGTSRRRRRQQAQPTEEKTESKAGMVTDPTTEPLLKVTMTFSVYDFRTLEPEQAESADKAKQAEDEK